MREILGLACSSGEAVGLAAARMRGWVLGALVVALVAGAVAFAALMGEGGEGVPEAMHPYFLTWCAVQTSVTTPRGADVRQEDHWEASTLL